MTKKSLKEENQENFPQDLEHALKALEKVVEGLENSDLPLEKAIELFAQGSKLSEICNMRLKEAEKKVQVLLKKVPEPSSKADFNVKDLDVSV